MPSNQSKRLALRLMLEGSSKVRLFTFFSCARQSANKRYRDDSGRYMFDASTRLPPQGHRYCLAESSGISALKTRVLRCSYGLNKETELFVNSYKYNRGINTHHVSSSRTCGQCEERDRRARMEVGRSLRGLGSSCCDPSFVAPTTLRHITGRGELE